MPGLRYVGADYSEDGNSSDVVDKGDVDTEFENATVTQGSVQAAINSAVSTMASSTYVNTALEAFVQPNFLNATNAYTLAIVITSTTSGNYTLTYGNQTTAAIAWNATAVTIQTTLGALTNLSNVVVAGQPGGPYQITLQPVGGSVALSVNTTNLSNGTASLNPSNMIPENWVGTWVPPIVSGTIPQQFIPSLGFGYVLGPFGATATFPVSGAGSSPVKFADFNIGPTGISNQPMALLNLLVSGVNGARPIVDVCISSGQQPYASQTLIARGVGRSCWNDLQAITVLPVPSVLGHTGLANTGYSPTFNAWISAWLYDANNESVSMNVNNIVAAGCWFWRYQQ
jgi:hypothetical protein